MATIGQAEQAARIVADAGGRVVGKTRLQKIAFMLEASGLGEGFNFHYRHYGPFSDEVADATGIAVTFGMLSEEEKQAAWGGAYSIFTSTGVAGSSSAVRKKLAGECVNIDAVELELAATALYLAKEGVATPWAETARRKPEKAAGRLEQSKQFYNHLVQAVPEAHLPAIQG